MADLRKNHLNTYAYFFTKVITKPKNHPYHLKPAGTYAVAYLMGNYYDSKDTYEKLFDWIDEHKFKTGKYSYKEAVIDENIDTSVLTLPLHRVSSALPLHFS